MKKLISSASILYLVFSLTSCCKCKPDIKNLNTIYLENFSFSEIVHPNVIISYSDTKDTIALTTDTVNAIGNQIKLKAPKTIDIKGDWLVRINDSLHYTINAFQTRTGKVNCCNGVTSIDTYQINGEVKQIGFISIEK